MWMSGIMGQHVKTASKSGMHASQSQSQIVQYNFEASDNDAGQVFVQI